MTTTTITRDFHNTIVKELKNTKLADAIVNYNELCLEEFTKELEKRWNDARQQNKYELRDELAKELVTKSDMENTRVLLKADIDQSRTELKADIDQVRTELKADIDQVRTELKADINQVRTELKADINQVRTELKADIDQVRTELKADINQVKTELKADIKLTNLKMMFQTTIIILIVLATTPGGTHLLEKIFPFIR